MSDYEYRFAAVRGLERKFIGTHTSMIRNALADPPVFRSVDGDDFLAMTWQELEHVAHVIRDATDTKEKTDFERQVDKLRMQKG